jgi:hypothetical protein
MSLEPQFTFAFAGADYAVERNYELLGDLTDRSNSRPFWRLTRAGVGLQALPWIPGESNPEVQGRFEAWLREHASEVTIAGRSYQLYRMARDFWSPDKDPTPSYVAWVIRSNQASITQIEYRLAPTLEAAIDALHRWLAAHAYECFGGPEDGQRTGDLGPEYRPYPAGGRWVRGGRPLQTSGRYVRGNGRYDWVPDEEAEA